MRTIAARLKAFLRETDGSMTAEFVAVTPVLLTVLVFGFEFGRALFAYEVMTSDVEAAVRYIALLPKAECQSVTGNDVINAQNLAECALMPASGTAPTSCAPHFPWNASSKASLSVTNAGSFSTPNFDMNGSIVQVKAELPLTLAMLGYMGVTTSYTLVATDQARCTGN
jgi:Flp pilus assembly protein TadG